jgi:hypothetical protein
MTTDIPDQINILKGEIGRQSRLKYLERDNANHKGKHLMKAWYSMKMCCDTHDELKELIWDYVATSREALFVKMNSRVFNIKTTIGEYTRKNGSKTLAHFTDNNCYYGSIKQHGELPVFYEGNFRITKDKFMIDLDRLEMNTPIERIFIPKEMAKIEDDDLETKRIAT